jgi:hypothetical protein
MVIKMLYTSREKLTVLEIADDTESVGFDVLQDVLMDRPANMIYVENSGGTSGYYQHGRHQQGSQIQR